jgi:peptidoglycan/xylan/chitin deacetylase (PgdA/CDA1 family)
MIRLIKLAARIANQRLILPFYHAVSNNPPPHLKHLYKIRSVETFTNDLDYLLKIYEPISMETLVAYIKGEGSLPNYAFLLSFDDGLREFAQNAWPVLKQKNIPVTLFVNPGFIETDALFYRLKASLLIEVLQQQTEINYNTLAHLIPNTILDKDALIQFIQKVDYSNKLSLDALAVFFDFDFVNYKQTNQPYLNLQELKELAAQGVTMGAHSMNHPLFNKLDDAAKFNQFHESMQWLILHLNPAQHTFSFPFTDYGIGQSFFNKMQNSEVNLEASFGTAGLKNEQIKFHYQRIPVENYSLSMQNILAYQYLYYFAKSPFYKNTIKR